MASAESVTSLRTELAKWLRTVGVSADVAYDLVLSSYEAMANVVAHAYPAGTTGFLNLDAHLGKDDITVTVRDRGSWKPTTGTGGRGLALMRHLSNGMDLTRGEHGTTVDMRWHRT